jgi:drug/metabolite transporter (DMT)-like permease
LVFAWLLLGEGLSVQKLIGAAVIVASCVLVAFGESESELQGIPLAAEGA